MRIAIIGRTGRQPDCPQQDTDSLFKYVGGNTGNLAFWYAVDQLVMGEKEYFGWQPDYEYINKHFDALIFVAANQLYPGFNLDPLIRLFESVNLPAVVIGLGGHAQLDNPDYYPPENHQRFLRIISERCATIGIRGTHTATLLEKINVTNYEITGCPSMLINPDAHLGRTLQPKYEMVANDESIDRILINPDFKDQCAPILRQFHKLALERDCQFECQHPASLVHVARGEYRDAGDNFLHLIKRLMFPSRNFSYVRDFLNERFHCRFDAVEWIEYCRLFDLSIGTRMHGNLLAMQAEVPCFQFPHDTRTLELCELLMIPHMKITDVDPNGSVLDAVRSVPFDGAAFDKNRSIISGRIKKVFEQSGIKIASYVDDIIGDGILASEANSPEQR